MAVATRKFQAPKGTRDFYPDDMAVRRHLESAWREVSVNHGFDEVDGPTFEHLDLYTVKSGDEIVSELFSFRRSGGDTDYALRPEFTPTLARMVAARAAQLPKPIRWYCIPSFFRAERPQRGRLREFYQWNADIVGDDSAAADAEIVAVTVNVLRRLGVESKHVTIRLSHRGIVTSILGRIGVAEAELEAVLRLLDRRAKLDEAAFAAEAGKLGFDADRYRAEAAAIEKVVNDAILSCEQGRKPDPAAHDDPAVVEMIEVVRALDEFDVLKWCEFDMSIVRGLAYYTGAVFEVHEASGKERAIAGGGRYDRLVELFGGPPTPAVGMAMGDVVIRLVLEDLGLLKPAEQYLSRPDVFVISLGSEQAEAAIRPLLARLRRAGVHARQSARATKNVGKLLGEAGKVRARFAAILGEELAEGRIALKNLDSGDQTLVPLDELERRLAVSPSS